MLHGICPNLLECQDMRGLTPLYVACSRNQAKVTTLIVCELLHKRREGEEEEEESVGKESDGKDESDSEGPLPLLKYTAKKGAIDCLLVLLKRADQSTLFKLLTWMSLESNLFKVLQELLKRSEEFEMSTNQDEITALTKLCAEKGQTESLLELVAWADKDIINEAKYGKGDSLIHLIARNGHHQTTKAILQNPDVETNGR
eukprot:XP_011683826.1 PREDICTED: uncharacterized protein LOC105447457 [Strongylocentrotus purpuratus]